MLSFWRLTELNLGAFSSLTSSLIVSKLSIPRLGFLIIALDNLRFGFYVSYELVSLSA